MPEAPSVVVPEGRSEVVLLAITYGSPRGIRVVSQHRGAVGFRSFEFMARTCVKASTHRTVCSRGTLFSGVLFASKSWLYNKPCHGQLNCASATVCAFTIDLQSRKRENTTPLGDLSRAA